MEAGHPHSLTWGETRCCGTNTQRSGRGEPAASDRAGEQRADAWRRCVGDARPQGLGTRPPHPLSPPDRSVRKEEHALARPAYCIPALLSCHALYSRYPHSLGGKSSLLADRGEHDPAVAPIRRVGEVVGDAVHPIDEQGLHVGFGAFDPSPTWTATWRTMADGGAVFDGVRGRLDRSQQCEAEEFGLDARLDAHEPTCEPGERSRDFRGECPCRGGYV